MPQLLDCRFAADTAQLKAVRGRVRAALEEYGCAHEFTETSVLAIEEAITNVMRHGYGLDSTQQLWLSIRADAGKVVFGLRDFAQPFDPGNRELLPAGEVRAGGYGLLLIREIMDSIRYFDGIDGQGNLLEMTRRLELATHLD